MVELLPNNAAPFQVGTELELGDGLEQLDDGSIAILSEILPAGDEDSDPKEFYDDLTDDIDTNEQLRIVQAVWDGFEDDAGSRETWFRRYKKALKTMNTDPTATGSAADERRASLGLSSVTHPMIAEAAQNLASRAILELCPKNGAVGIESSGEANEDLDDRAERTQAAMNYQTTVEMTEYYQDMDRMVYHLGFVGHTFKKSWHDPVLRRRTSRFVTAEEVVVHDQITSDLESCQRLTHQLNITKEEYDAYVAEGYYRKLAPGSEQMDDEQINKVTKDIEGISPISETTDNIYLLEQHVLIHVEGDDKNDTGIAVPYIITVHPSSHTIVRLQRNWDEDDDGYRKLEWFVDYRMLPGFGYYGYGYYHLLSGLNEAATGSLRSLLDSASYANLQGGFKLRGRLQGGDVAIGAGEFKDIEATVDDIRKAVMPLPFKEPSQAMYNMMQYIDGRGAQYAGSVEKVINEAGANTPVGTIMAIIDESSKPQSAIFRRLTESLGREFRILYRLNGIYMEDTFEFTFKSKTYQVTREDFGDDLRIYPTADPENFNTTKRVMKAQLMMDMADKYPQFHDPYKAVKRFYEAARIEDYDEVLIDPTDTVRLDAANENIAMLMGKPIKVYEDQDHASHMMVLDQWFASLPPQFQQIVQMSYMSHRAEHMAFLYRAQLQARMQAPLPPVPDDISIKSSQMEEVSAEQDYLITQATAVLINQAPVNMGPPPPAPQGDGAQGQTDPAAAIAAQAQAEAQAVQVKTQAQIAADQAKTQNQITIDNAKAQNAQATKAAELEGKTQIEAVKADRQMQMKEAEAALDMQLKLAEHRASMEVLMAKTQADIAAKQDQMEANIVAKMGEMVMKGRMDEQAAEVEAVKQVADVLKGGGDE